MADPECLLVGLLCFILPGACVIAVLISRATAARLQRPDRERERRCVGCGVRFARHLDCCPACRLDPLGEAAAELRDLEAAARTVTTLRDRGGLEASLCAQVQRCIEARQRLLRNAVTAVPRLVDESAAILLCIEQWLGNGAPPEALTAQQRESLLRGYRVLWDSDLHALSATALAGLARLLATTGVANRALAVYRVLLTQYPAATEARSAALDASRLAVDERQWATARWFLAQRLDGRDAADDPEVQAVLTRLDGRAAADARPKATPVDDPVPVARVVKKVVQPPSAPSLPSAAPPTPAAPRRSVWEWLAVFMEERNVLWGEVVGGMLIVGCSIALVISLWQTLERVPLFPFLIFATLTSSLLAAGFYTLSHWKLESTSRGLLLIGMLMVPLNFLVLAGLSRDLDMGVVEIATAGAVLIGLAWLTRRAGHTLVATPLAEAGAGADWLFLLAVLAPAVAHLLGPHLLTDAAPAPIATAALGLLATLGPAAGLGIVLMRLAVRPTWHDRELRGLFVLAGVGTFAAATALGLLVYCGPALHGLGLPIAVAGIALLVTGALVHRRIAEQPATAAEAAPLASPSLLWGTAGTITALLGIAAQFAAFAVALPHPAERWLVGAVNGLSLATAAWALRLPLLHAPAQVYLVLLVYAGWSDAPGWTLPLRMAVLLVVQAVVAEQIARLGRRVDALYYAIGATVSTALAAWWCIPLALSHPVVAALALGTGGGTWLLANLRWRRAFITYAGLALLLGAALPLARLALPALAIIDLGMWTALAHASFCVLLTVAIAPRRSARPWLDDSYVGPARTMALVGTALAVLQLPVTVSHGPFECSIVAGWLALVWLALAWHDTEPYLFAGFQLALSLSVAAGTIAWAQAGQWTPLEPNGVHACGLALAGLGLIWESMRRIAPRHARLRELLLPDNLAVEREILALLITGQLVLAVLGVLPSMAAELSGPSATWMFLPQSWYPALTEPAAWLLLALLAASLLVAVRPTNLFWPSIGLAALLLTVPVLLAQGPFAADRASASALRWGLALCFLTGSVLLWLRVPLERWLGYTLPSTALRGLLVAAYVVPVLLLTCGIASLRLRGMAIAGPLPGTLFARLGGSWSLLVPLAMISATWAGHGLRDRVPRALFAGGLLGCVSLMAGRLLQVHRAGLGVLPEHWVQTLQLGAGSAWLWTMFWIMAARLRAPAVSNAKTLRDSPLLDVMAYLGALLLGMVLVPAVIEIALGPTAWVHEAGATGSWVILALTATGVGVRAWDRGRLSVHALRMLSAAAGAILACTGERLAAGYGAAVLMLAAATLSLAWAWAEPLWTQRHSLASAAFVWCCACGACAVILALRTLFRADHHLPAAAALLLVSVTCASLAWQRRHEGWAVACGPLLVLAVNFILWRIHINEPLDEWAGTMIRIDLAVIALATLVWLRFRQQLYDGALHVAESPCLCLHIGVGFAGNAFLIGVLLPRLILLPRQPGGLLTPAEALTGWLALLPNLIAVGWYVALVALRRIVHVLGGGGLLLGVLSAATVQAIAPLDWLAHHVLTASWTGVALLVVALAWSSEHMAQRLDLLRVWLPHRSARAWATGCGSAVVLVALIAVALEPASPYWPSVNVLAVGVLFGALALWARRPFYSYAAGLTINVIGLFLHAAWARRVNAQLGGALLGTFVSTQVICFAVAGAAWSGIEHWLVRHAPSVSLRTATVPYAHFALTVGLHLLGLLIGLAVALQIAGLTVMDAAADNPLYTAIGEPLAWGALLAIGLASLLCAWDERYASVMRYNRFTLGLIALGLFMQALPLTLMNNWYPPLLLGGYVLAAAVWDRLHEDRGDWLSGYQIVLTAAVAVLSIPVTFGHAGGAAALAGPLACLYACLTWMIVARVRPRELRHGALVLGLLVMLEIPWALIDPHVAGRPLQHTSAALVVLVAMAGLYRLAGRVPRVQRAWRRPCRNVGTALVVASYATLLVLLAMEIAWYDARDEVRATPLLGPLVLCVSAAALVLIGMSVYLALTAETDPLGVPVHRRGLYVYAAQAVLVGLLLHLRLNVPDLIPPVLGRYWTVTLLVEAFVGVGLAEFFLRRGWAMLAYPLRRTAIVVAFVPVLAYSVQPLAGWQEAIGSRVAGLQPLLRYLHPDRFPGGAAMHALCWLLLGLLHAWLARTRKSPNQLLLAALFINFGVWVLLGTREELALVTHPQLWLIPVGLILLAAELINRERLGPWPSAALRSVGLLCIYLSSTIDMLLTGLGESVLLPIALALLSVLGVLLGILLRVRMVLLFGCAFLGVVVFAQIWHAAVDRQQAWVWWASGVVLGLAIVALFAYFEKHRGQVLRMLDDVRQWK